jgi:hypothetical protein
MPLFCYVHCAGAAVPYFEVLPDMPGDRALRRAAELLADRPDGLRAELWEDDRLIHTIERQAAPAA